MDSELVKRLEAATTDERGLYEEAFWKVFPAPPNAHLGKDIPALEAHTDHWLRYRAMLDAGAYESAAMMIVPEGRAWVLYSDGPTYEASAEIGSHPQGGELMRALHSAGAATPGLALLIASLRARGME